MRFNLLSSVDADEVSPVERAANRKRFALLKEESGMPDAELEDMLAAPWEHEGAMIDLLRKEGVDESVQKAMLAVIRLAKGIEDELPEPLRIVVEKLGTELYPATNKPLNKDGDEETGQDEKDDAGDEKTEKRDFSQGQRDEDADSGKALPDGSFPIENEGDLKNAIRAVGRAKDRGRAMAHIKARAKTLGLSKLLPDKWVSKADADGDSADEDAEEHGNVMKEDIVAEESYAVPVQKEDGTWDLSGVPDEAKPVWSAVLKSNEVLGEKLQKAEEQIADQRNTLREREFVAKAESSFDVLAPADELGPILKAAADGMDEETYGKLESILAAAAERVQKGDLFVEKGKTVLNDGSRTGAYATAVAKAKEIVEKAEKPLTQDQAMAQVFELHPELYSEYLVETAGGVS